MQLIYKKLREARLLLNITQKNASLKSGISQRDISLLENGKKEFIPVKYIQFLSMNNIDINSIYNDSFQNVKFLKNTEENI